MFESDQVAEAEKMSPKNGRVRQLGDLLGLGRCVVVFAASGDLGFELRCDPCAIGDEPVRALAMREARTAGAVIDFGDDDDDTDR